MHPFSTTGRHQKTLQFSDVFRGTERVLWEQMGSVPSKWSVFIFSIKSYETVREFWYQFAQIMQKNSIIDVS